MHTAADQTPTLNRKERKDLKVLALFTAVYCGAHHADEGDRVRLETDDPDLQGLGLERHRFCTGCRDFLLYAFTRRLKCPLDPKPVCKHCRVHCYRQGHRERVREVMRFSGRHLIRRGRIDLLWHYFF